MKNISFNLKGGEERSRSSERTYIKYKGHSMCMYIFIYIYIADKYLKIILISQHFKIY